MDVGHNGAQRRWGRFLLHKKKAQKSKINTLKKAKKSELTTLQNAKKNIEKGQRHLGELWDDHSSQRDIKGQKKRNKHNKKGQKSQKKSPNERRCEI